MNLKMLTNKRGGYIVEAALTLPVFIIAVVIMNSIILMYACIEDCMFITANELRRGAAEAAVADTSVVVPYRIKKQIEEKHSMVRSARTTDAGFRTERWGVDDLIIVNIRMKLCPIVTLGSETSAEYDLSLVTRAYVGRERDEDNMPASGFADEGAEVVYIFPKRGEKYHSKGCLFLRAASTSAALTDSLKRKYRACPICHSGNAGNGSLIYYFPDEGEAYHLAGCASLQRNYIEIDRETAVKRGYTPCSRCGG